MTEKSGCCTPQREDHGKAKPVLPLPEVSSPKDHHARHAIQIPGGKSFIGTDHALLPVDEEAPYRSVKLNSFHIDPFAVTNDRFAEFVAATGYQTEAEVIGNSFVFVHFLDDQKDYGNAVAAAPWWRLTEGACWQHPTGPESSLDGLGDHPVVHISWHDASAFATWAGGRLPTEAEWEHAARGGLGDVFYPWGNQHPDDTGFYPCNIWQGSFPNHNLKRDGVGGTAPTHAFEPNGHGLYNMVGNVWEWTDQSFKLRSLKKAMRQTHQGKTGFKICKGGSYLCHASYCHRYRIAARTANSPDSSTGHTGFRLVYDI